ncbi:MAG: carbonic anhydrase [Candidatus Zixiibacteriota bacterium]
MERIASFISGFQRFREKFFTGEDSPYRELQDSQSPHSLVIACSDSRVDPAIVFDAQPGELFVVRNVANLVPPYVSDGGTHGVSAALEFGVRALKVRHIIIMGHSHCGGIQALLNSTGGEFISQWMKTAEQAVRHAAAKSSDPEERTRECELASIRNSLDNLMTFPWIRERVESSDLRLHGWYFDLEHGRLEGFDRTQGAFVQMIADSKHSG